MIVAAYKVQLVEHRNAITKVIHSNPAETWLFIRLYCNCFIIAMIISLIH